MRLRCRPLTTMGHRLPRSHHRPYSFSNPPEHLPSLNNPSSQNVCKVYLRATLQRSTQDQAFCRYPRVVQTGAGFVRRLNIDSAWRFRLAKVTISSGSGHLQISGFLTLPQRPVAQQQNPISQRFRCEESRNVNWLLDSVCSIPRTPEPVNPKSGETQDWFSVNDNQEH